MKEMAECAQVCTEYFNIESSWNKYMSTFYNLQISMSVFETQMTVVNLPGVPTHRVASHVPVFKGTEEMVECAMVSINWQ